MAVGALPTQDHFDEPWATGLGHLLWEVTTIVTLEGEARLAGSSLTLASNGMLDYLIAAPGITVAEVARRTPKTPQAISQIVARLEKLGYVERRLGPGRGVGLHATEAGRVANRRGRACEEANDAEMLERLGVERYEELRRLLGEARAQLTVER